MDFYEEDMRDCRVSIRFEVRGGFRQQLVFAVAVQAAFQSALRFAVVSDETRFIVKATYDVSIRFEVRGGFRPLLRQEE